jgi:hypothetical protein
MMPIGEGWWRLHKADQRNIHGTTGISHYSCRATSLNDRCLHLLSYVTYLLFVLRVQAQWIRRRRWLL